LCEKDEIPRTIVGGSGFGCRRQSEAGTTNEIRDQSLVHHHFLQSTLLSRSFMSLCAFSTHAA
jgi:hypothetical protein